MKNIYTEGLELTREDGSVITLTPQEIHTVGRAIRAMEGFDSIIYYLENARDILEWYGNEDEISEYDREEKERIEKYVSIAEEIAESPADLANLWDDIEYDLMQDSGEVEIYNIEYTIKNILESRESSK